MQLLLNFNYKKVSVCASSTDKVAVSINASRFEHFQFAGLITLERAIEQMNQGNEGHFAAFFGSSGWRRMAIDSWSFTGNEEHAVAFVLGDKAYAVIAELQPLIWSTAHFGKVVYPTFDPSKVENKADNVINLFPTANIAKTKSV